MKKRLLCLTSVLLICIMILSGCSEAKKEQEESTTDVSKTEGTEYLVPHLGKGKEEYKGKTLKVLATWDHMAFATAQTAPEESNGEPVNDAFRKRNQMLEQEYGFRIEGEFTPGWDDFTIKVRNDMQSNTADYDVVTTGAYYLAPLAVEGYLEDLNNLKGSNLCLDKEWWDISADEDMTLGGHLYFTTGDIFVLDDETTCVTYFNKGIAEELHLDNPYDLVKSSDWTIDKMYEMSKAAVLDDGDGEMTVVNDDRWGFVCTAFDTYKYISGCGCPMVEKNDDDYPVLSITNEKNTNAFLKVFDMIDDRQSSACLERFYAWNSPDGHYVSDNFYNGKALFMSAHISEVNNQKMRNAEIRYGILPNPKFDKGQKNYQSPVEPYSFYCLGIPVNQDDIDFITFALEAMAYTGNKYVRPEYFERTLKNKRFVDDDSPEMLDIIINNRIIDISTIFNWNDCIQYYNQLLVLGSSNLASFTEARQEAFDIAMNQTIAEMEKNNH